MSQWKSKYHVLEENNSDPSLTSHEPQPMSATPSLLSSPPEKIYIRNTNLRFSIQVPLQLKTLDTGLKLGVTALLDCGATALFLDTRFVRENNLNTRKLPRAVPVYNVDGTLNQGGSIQEEVDLIMTFKDHTEKATFAVCNLGDKTAILGYVWLWQHNPEVNWRTGEVQLSRCPDECHVHARESMHQKEVKETKKEKKRKDLPSLLSDNDDDDEVNSEHGLDNQEEKPEIEAGDRVFLAFLHPKEHINATSTVSQKLAEEAHQHDSQTRSFEDLVPQHYHTFRGIFSKESFDQLPPRKPWDHAIELKPGSEPHRCKIYPLSPNEQKELDSFLEENVQWKDPAL